MCAVKNLPQWDMSVIFPNLESPEFENEFYGVADGLRELLVLFDELGVARQENLGVDADTVQRFETVMSRFNSLLERLITVKAYIIAFVSTDSRNEIGQARLSEMQKNSVLLSQLQSRFTAWIGSMDVSALVRTSTWARDHAYVLEKATIAARHQMSQAEEDLAAHLGVTGGVAWSKLHDDLTSQLMVEVDLEGERQQLPMTMVRNLAVNQNRSVRKAGYGAELHAWQRIAVPLAAALNSIKGETNTLNRARGWKSGLDLALFNTNIDRQTLDTMMEAARASFPDFRRYLSAKARTIGVVKLAWYDLFAPVGNGERSWEFDFGVDFLLKQFGAYSPALRAFAERALGAGWIDAEPREGKAGGAFCMWVRGGESRILANYVPSFDGMSTLAHELGHAYHNYTLRERSPLQRNNPMTLAETASIFCQTIVREAALAHATEDEQLVILDASLTDDCQVVMDITSRFLFETAVFEGRQQREMSVDELNAIMLDSQRQTYGDALDPSNLHPYMWAVKGHYYSAGRPYYNFPYMFGLLFGLGLYARYQEDSEAFRSRYDELLSSTGLADAATLARGFGIDLRSQDFWTSSLDVVRANVDQFVRLVDTGVVPGVKGPAGR